MQQFTPAFKDIRTTFLFFPLFFVFLYLDSISLPISPDIFWKLPALIVLLLLVLKNREYKYPKFFVLGLAFAVKELLVIAPKGEYYVAAAGTAALDLVPPILTFFFIRYFSYKQIGKYLFIFCSCIILATIPYHLGIIKQSAKNAEMEASYDLVKFGGVGRVFTGPYLNVHGASITIAVALIGLLFNLKKNISKVLYAWILGLTLVGLVSIYLTYVRTAFVMLFIGLLIYLFYGKKGSNIFRAFITLLIFAIIFYIVYLNSSILQLRLSNTNAYGSEVAAGSGRFDFWTIMLHYSVNNGIFSFFSGTGREAGKDYMLKVMQERLFSHNGFIDILVSSGFIGLVIYFFFLKTYFKRLFKKINRTLPSFKMLLIVFIMYIAAIVFQQHEFFLIYIIIALIVSLLEKEYKFANAVQNINKTSVFTIENMQYD